MTRRQTTVWSCHTDAGDARAMHSGIFSLVGLLFLGKYINVKIKISQMIIIWAENEYKCMRDSG